MDKDFLTEQEFNRAIIDYFSLFIDGKYVVSKYIFMAADHLNISFTLTVFNQDNKEVKKIRLGEKEITQVLNNHLKKTDEEIESYRFIAGVRKVGIKSDEEEAYLEGIRIKTREKEKGQGLLLTQNINR